MLFSSSDYSYNATCDYSFGVASRAGKGDVVPYTTHLSSHEDDIFIDGGDFLSSRSKDCSKMVNSNKDKLSNPLSQRHNDDFIVSGVGGSSVGPRITHFSSHKSNFV